MRLGLGPEGVGPAPRSARATCFGEMALVTGAPRSADVVAVEDTVLWALDRADFEALTARSVPSCGPSTAALGDRLAC